MKITMFKNHVDIRGKDNNLHNCDICGKSFTVPARLTRHYRTHTGEKPFQCEYCKKSFSVKENLSVHRRIHTKERPYKCEICEKSFEHSGKLHRHMRIHTGERPHKCIFCDKTFIQSGQLVIHMRTHTGEKPYVCKLCGKGFTCSKQLKVHNRTHTGEKPYTCDICNKSFGYNHVLKLHQAAHYGEKFYKCIVCQDTFNSKKSMEMHLKNHSEPEFIQNTLSKESPNNTFTDSEWSCGFINKIDAKITSHKNIKTRKSKTAYTPEIAIFDNFRVKQISIHNNKNKNDSYNYDSIDSFLSHKICSKTHFKGLSLDQSHKNIEYANSCSTVNGTSHSSLYDTNFVLRGSHCRKMENRLHLKKSLQYYYFNRNCTHCQSNDNIIEQNHNQLKNFHDFKNDTLLKDISKIHSKDTMSPFCIDSINILLSDKIEALSLPPRKRSKIILKSMEMEMSKLNNVSQCNSVIKFAKKIDLI